MAIKTLDLHGVRHDDVERLVENFVLLNEPPLKIITGNSDRMSNIVIVKLSELLNKYFTEEINIALYKRGSGSFHCYELLF